MNVESHNISQENSVLCKALTFHYEKLWHVTQAMSEEATLWYNCTYLCNVRLESHCKCIMKRALT